MIPGIAFNIAFKVFIYSEKPDPTVLSQVLFHLHSQNDPAGDPFQPDLF